MWGERKKERQDGARSLRRKEQRRLRKERQFDNKDRKILDCSKNSGPP